MKFGMLILIAIAFLATGCDRVDPVMTVSMVDVVEPEQVEPEVVVEPEQVEPEVSVEPEQSAYCEWIWVFIYQEGEFYGWGCTENIDPTDEYPEEWLAWEKVLASDKDSGKVSPLEVARRLLSEVSDDE